MNLSAPTMIVFVISVVLAILGLLAQYTTINLYLAPFYWMLIAWIVLAAGNLLKGL
ncbi:MAG: hypothetical protein BroJett030_28690 [Alphaproteobacteria bacterium]|nr:MAG: hypothetical protein BroJett030_28690 [Alphaproteobacteria bacterium]